MQREATVMFSHTQEKAQIIFVIGGPGSGKGTHCSQLQRDLGYHHISTGDLIRHLLADSTQQSADINEIRTKMSRGELLDDAMITEILANEMRQHPDAQAFLIDGYPRTLAQLQLFENTQQPCHKVLFFDAPDAVLKERLLARSTIERRADDNAEAIAHRLKVYQAQTLLVIQALAHSKTDKFIRIDTSGTLAATRDLVNKALEKPAMTTVSVFEFLASYLKTGNFYDAIETLEQRYQNTDFKVALAFTTFFYVIQSKDDVKKVLSANTIAGFQNHNFDVSHGHFLNINALPAFIDGEINPLWHVIHTGLLHGVGNAKSISTLIAKHFHKFLDKREFSLDIEFQHFMEAFWCEFMFGSQADANRFSDMRGKLIAALRYSYYDSRIKNIPYLGTQACKFYAYLNKNQFADIDAELGYFIARSNDCLLSRFRADLLKNADFPADKVDTAILDNAFVLILALDFIQNAMYETLKHVVKSGLKTTAARNAAYSEGLHEAFLFPFRTRVPRSDLVLQTATVTKGTPIYINLLKSGLYHSAGPRSCVGIGMTQWIKDAIWEQLKDVEFELQDTTYPADREQLSHSLDVPQSAERLEVSWHYSRDYLQKILPHYEFKGVKEFFDVLKIYENADLSHYVSQTFLERIKQLNLDTATLCIAAPEVRGIPVAAVVAEALHVPLVIIRKHGKTPGATVTASYQNAYEKEIIELSTHADVKDRNVIFIDDGIASGGTTMASCDLIKQLGGKVALILAMINHTYKEKIVELSQYPVETLFDFASQSPKIENKIISMSAASARRTHALFQPARAVQEATKPVINYPSVR
jgi:adenine phosphoribosyltransferase